jgi:hypothetical protein
VGSALIVLPAVLLKEVLSLAKAVEELAVQELVAKAAVEALRVPVLPRAAGRDEQRPDPALFEPLAHGRRDELWSVVPLEEAMTGPALVRLKCTPQPSLERTSHDFDPL